MVSNVIAGYNNGERFLGTVDMFGTKFETNHVVTGMASNFTYNYRIYGKTNFV